MEQITRKTLPKIMKDICGNCSECCVLRTIATSSTVDSLNKRLNIPAEKKRVNKVLSECKIFGMHYSHVSGEHLLV